MGETTLSTRAAIAIAAAEGNHRETLQTASVDALLSASTESQQERIRSALDGDLCVYPLAPGMYRVVSEGVDDDDAEYYTDALRVSRCECGDFMYRCRAEQGDQCKHLWRVRFLVNRGGLPEPDDDPYEWCRATLERDYELVADSCESDAEVTRSLEEACNRIADESLATIDFEWVIETRASALARAAGSE